MTTSIDPDRPVPLDLRDVDLAFPARALDWMPPADEVPPGDPWAREFFYGALMGTTLTDVSLLPAEDVDAEQAWRTITAISASYAPKHEHKEAVVTWLLSIWFIGATGSRNGTQVTLGSWPTSVQP